MYQKTKSEIPPPSKRRKSEPASVQSIRSTGLTGKSDTDEMISEASNGGLEDAFLNSKVDNMVCPKHTIHLFHDKVS